MVEVPVDSIVFNKPYGVLTRFTDQQDRANLSHYIDLPGVYPVGRLDKDSEGLLLLTRQKRLVEPLLKPGGKEKEYLVCVEGLPSEAELEPLRRGVKIKDGACLPAGVELIDPPEWLWQRDPPIRFRKSVPTSWLRLTLREGRNRQVRRMTAAVGYPTLRLVRTRIGPLLLGELELGSWRALSPDEARALSQLVKDDDGRVVQRLPRRGRRKRR